QLLYIPRRGLGGPLWVDAPAFDLSDHVRVVPLPAPGDEAALLLATEQLRRRRLDRSRPLWQMCFLPGLPENRVGMFVKMHHAIADGIAGGGHPRGVAGYGPRRPPGASAAMDTGTAADGT
ncbi:MAG TPA: wax ester/triacylglycerol synthase domain-containing protein, partial [Streptosporangiaceae bacterium]|nr:wax ester/triacylglycerol synthase domain-containing protein [Streptosporangiaceae bacterium]